VSCVAPLLRALSPLHCCLVAALVLGVSSLRCSPLLASSSFSCSRILVLAVEDLLVGLSSILLFSLRWFPCYFFFSSLLSFVCPPDGHVGGRGWRFSRVPFLVLRCERALALYNALLQPLGGAFRRALKKMAFFYCFPRNIL